MKQKPTYQELEKELEDIKTTNNLIEKSPIVRFVWKNLENWSVEYASENVKSILGYSTNDFVSGKIVYSKIIHEEDLQRVSNEVKENSKTDKVSFEHKPYRIISKTGKIKWIKDITLIRRNEDKEITHYEGIIFDVTAQKQAEQALLKSEEKFKTVANFTYDWEYWIGIDENLIYISPSCEQITGYSPDEFYKNPNLMTNIIHPEDANTFKNHVHNILGTNEIEPINFRIITKNKKERWIGHICQAVYDKNGNNIGQRGSNRDITTQKRAEKDLIESEKKFNAIFNSNPNPTHLINTNFEIILTNSKLLQLKDLEQKAILGKKCYEIYQNKQEVCENCGVKKVFKEKVSVKKENKLILPNGSIKYFETYAYPIFDKQGNILYAVETTIDITERKNIEQKLQKQNEEYASLNEEYKIANEELIIAKEKAEESNQLKTEFINNMSHEIRTPMNGILGFSNFLNNHELSNEKIKHYTSIIQSSGKQLMHIIDDILEISKLGTKQVKFYEKEICLNDLFLKLFSIFDIKAKENKTPLYLNKELSDKESIILTDETKLNKILSNLLENALKFTNEGFIEFGYKIVKTQGRASQIEIYVKDTGIGIKPESQKIIFVRFSQEEKSLSRNVGGLGLGLSIAKENAELLGGKITLKSEKGKGSTFFVTIPYKPVKKSETLNLDNEKVKITEKQDKYTILIVEDEEVNYLYIDTLLEDIELNLTTLHAKHGKEAVEICKENSEIDFVFMDLKMPIMSGFEATKLIKEFRPDLPIVAQTAYSTREEKGQAISAGCDDFISKPISEETLNGIINKYLIMR